MRVDNLEISFDSNIFTKNKMLHALSRFRTKNFRKGRQPMKEFESKHPYFWLILGLVLTIFSYGIFNTGICAWIFAIPLIRFINNRTKWQSIILMLIGMIIAANITFFRLVEDNFNIQNQVFCSLNGIRIWFPFFVYFLCRYIGAKKIIKNRARIPSALFSFLFTFP